MIILRGADEPGTEKEGLPCEEHGIPKESEISDFRNCCSGRSPRTLVPNRDESGCEMETTGSPKNCTASLRRKDSLAESQDMQKRAKLRCMHLLEKKDYTERELRRKLEYGRTSYSPEEIDGAIAYVKSYHYVDDARYAVRYIETMSTRKSRRQIEQELLSRGVDREWIDRAFEETEEIPEDTQIAEWIRKRHFDPETADSTERRRMYAFLARRGFDQEAISRALRVGQVGE